MILKNMILNTRLWIVLSGAIFLLILGLSIAGHALESRLAADAESYRVAGICMKSTFLLLTVGFAVCCLPVLVRGFLSGQERIGNGKVRIIAFCLRHEADIVIAFWTVWIIGLLIASPHVVRELIAGE